MGFVLFSAGQAWERGFEEALRFLEAEEGTLLLGPAIGDAAKAWIQDRALERKGVNFGARIQPWSEWLKARARSHTLEQGKAFRPLNQAAKRDHFRFVVKTLAESGAFHHLQEIWSEERFFAALLDCVTEARLAGLSDEVSIERAKESLAKGSDPVTRAAYEDFWNLLMVYERSLNGEEPRLDEASIVKLAAESELPSGPLFLLGFDALQLLEVELLQKFALSGEVRIPLALGDELISALLKQQADTSLDHPAALALRGLLTNFAGKISHLTSPKPNDVPRRRFLEAHAPSEEARAAAALARASQAQEVRFVVPPAFFEESSVARAFREELGLPRNFHPRRALSHPVARLFFHSLAIKEDGYSLAYGLELGQLLEFTRGEFRDLASRAARAGVRKGLGDWKRKASGDRELENFAALLESLDRILPEEGTAAEFAHAAEKLAVTVGIAELARRAPDFETERDAHAALAGVLRNAQMLAASTRTRYSFREWMRELNALLGKSLVGDVLSLFPRVQFYRYGEWLPPASNDTLTLALQLGREAGPSRGFHFYLEEGARRKLSDFLLPTQVQADLAFLDQLKRVARGGQVLFSWSRHDGSGKEQEANWAAGSLDLEHGTWPEIAPERTVPEFRASAEVKVPELGLPVLSPSLLELYKECPFKAFAEKVLRLEDKVQEASLDVSRLDEGSLVHKTLELYYGTRGGMGILDPVERERVLSECLDMAAQEQRIEYFKGNEHLFSAQLERTKRRLLEFLALDAENYARFPFFGEPKLEQNVEGTIGKYSWKGKIDRIDIDEANKRLLVLDYKIGALTPTSKEITEGKRFQLQLYQDGAEAAFPGYEAVGGLYASIESGKRNQGVVRKEFNQTAKALKPGETKYYKFGPNSEALCTDEEFRALREASRAEAARLAERIDAGHFPVEPLDEEKSCARCNVRPACRIRELRAPPRENWARVAPAELLQVLKAPDTGIARERKEARFNPEQVQALERKGFVFIEASAGTGKTTVIVEKIKRFLLEKIEVEPAHRAVERFSAISFTEKSAQELAARAARALIDEPKLGARVAAQAQQQVSTIHGFCRRVLADFPVEAGISPLAAMLDDKGTESLKAEVLEEFFLSPDQETRPLLERAFQEFSRAKIESLLRKLLEGKHLFQEEIARFHAGEGGLFPEERARAVLEDLLLLSERLELFYGGAKRERNVLDFNDLEALALKVLEHEHAREEYRKKLDLLLVDEFQDTNSVQRKILEAVARPGLTNLFVVGDAKQSIYRFRAADVSVFQNLRRSAAMEGALVALSRNYRSKKELVETANEITRAMFPASNEEAPDYEAVAALSIGAQKEGGKSVLVEYGDAEEKVSAMDRRSREAEIVAKLVSDLRARPGKPLSIAILLRKFAGNEAYLRALTRAGISFRVGASRGFYGQSLVTDSIALLRTLFGAKNDIALLSVLRSPWIALSDSEILAIQKRGEARAALWDKLEPARVPLLFEWKKRASHSSLSGMLEAAYAHYPMGRREHLQSLKLLRILEKLEAEGKPRMEILDRVSAWSGWDREGDASDEAIMPEPGGEGTVQVMTVHAAKGLEFDVTILADLVGKPNPDNAPLRMVRGEGIALKLEDEDKNEIYTEIGKRNEARELAELKRLFYVAVTRAKEEQYILLPRSHPELPREKWKCCADFVRAADLSGVAERIDGDKLGATERERGIERFSPQSSWPRPPEYPRFRDTSISEIAAFQFCEEFHRRKFVQAWDDRIVALWKKPPGSFRKFTAPKAPVDPERDRVAKLLKKLKIERKERGIALHRVLERVKHHEEDLEFCTVWLLEAYEAQGVDLEHPALKELLAIDRALLEKFLTSPLGRELFSSEIEAFPEIAFEWKLGEVRLHGAMDRLIRKKDGSWVVVDYKSSILEESFDRYRSQVAAYMAAVAAAHPHARVEGYLVDLFEARSYPVAAENVETRKALEQEIRKTAANYTLTESALEARQVRAGEHCFHCPYSLHCDLGAKVVLEFN